MVMAAQARAGDPEGVGKLGLVYCTGCGCCPDVCASHIPLVQHVNQAKGKTAARERAKRKQAETKRLAGQPILETIEQARLDHPFPELYRIRRSVTLASV
jgi:electron transport complex protein RnfC